MFNPLIDSLADVSEAELDSKIRELSRKYFQTRNPQVQQQISATLEMYKEELAVRNKKKLSQNSGNNDLDNLINID
jgi:ribosomal protein L29